MSPATVARSLLALVLVACATPQTNAVDAQGWVEIRTPEFVVVGNVSRDELRSLARELELFDALVGRMTTGRPERSVVPVRLYVFRDREQAQRFTGPAAAGILMPALPGYFAILSLGGADFSTSHVLFHEYSHYVLRRNRRVGYPRWYDEGLSEYLSSVRFRDDAILVGATLSERVSQLSAVGVMPFAELFEPETIRSYRPGAFYASAWALVHHLNASPDGRLRLRRFANRLVRGEAWRPAFAASFDVDVATLEAAVAEHVKQLERGARFDLHIRADALRVDSEASETPLPPAEVAYQLGIIVRLMAEPEQDAAGFGRAEALFAQALARDESHARARAALAWTRAFDGDAVEAAALLARAQQEAPDDAIVALEAGRVQLLRARREGKGSAAAAAARQTLERAAQLRPDLPEAHAALARAYTVEGRPPQRAIAAFERARARGAWNPELELDLARQYLAAGEARRAEALLVPVAADAHRGETAREARRMLEEARSRAGPGAPGDGAR